MDHQRCLGPGFPRFGRRGDRSRHAESKFFAAWASEPDSPAGLVSPNGSSKAGSSTSAFLPAPRACKSCRRRKSIFRPFRPKSRGSSAIGRNGREDSFEYKNTPRRFDFPAYRSPLLEEIRALAKKCWKLFSLSGWARVDFSAWRRGEGRPWILEINANPCLSPDAGFAAALDRAGIPFDEALQRIVDEVPLAAPQCGR